MDFTYEVSRSLAACEGALLLVDAAQGIQAQTMANVYLAMEHDLAIIPVVNKLDLPAAEPERVSTEIEQSFGFKESEIYRISAKTGEGVEDLLEAIVTGVEPPRGDPEAPLRALIFDSRYDPYKGVVAYVRVVDGQLKADEPAQLMGTGVTADILETGYFAPHTTEVQGVVDGAGRIHRHRSEERSRLPGRGHPDGATASSRSGTRRVSAVEVDGLFRNISVRRGVVPRVA